MAINRSRLRSARRILIAVIALLILSAGCSPKQATQSTNQPDPQSGFVLGEKVPVLDGVIPAGGGKVTVDSNGNPFDGTEIQVPDQAFQGDVPIHFSYRAVTESHMGPNFTPLTALFTVDFGGEQPSQYLTIKLPLQIPDGYFALPFHYDTASGDYEGIPVIAEDAGSMTFVAKRFSSFIVAAVKETVLNEDYGTSFEQGRDNFRFANVRTFIAERGMCAGQSLAAIYFNEQNTGAGLFDMFDSYNTGYHETPDLWQDDVMAIKLASLAHTRTFVEDRLSNTNYWYALQDEQSQLLTYFTVSYLMLLTGQPQLIVLNNDVTDGHAVVAYQKVGNTILVSDPNFPQEKDQKLTFNLQQSTFQPYESAPESTGATVSYDRIYYMPKKDAIDWQTLGNLWDQLLDGQFADDSTPTLAIKVAAEGQPLGQSQDTLLTNGYKTNKNSIRVYLAPLSFNARLTIWKTEPGAYPYNYKLLDQTALEPAKLDLLPGDNYFGFMLEKIDADGNMAWTDFQWINIQQDDTFNDPQAESLPSTRPGDLSLEVCDMTSFLSYEISEPKITTFSSTSPCSQDCSARITITNTSDANLNIYYFLYFFGRDDFGGNGERWDRLADKEPGQSGELGWMRRYAVSDACQWVNQGISKILAIREDPGCFWLEKEYEVGFENSAINMLELPNPCP